MIEQFGAALLGVVVGGAAPWPLKAVGRLFGSRVRQQDREQRLLDAKAEREARAAAGEMERLLAEIARLTARHGDLEDLVDLLRRELDKALVRGNASLTVARILLFAVDQEPAPSQAMIAAREQARRVIAAADDQINKGG